MKERILSQIRFPIFLLGAWAATANWFWGKGFISLWIVLWILTFLPAGDLNTRLKHVFLFITSAVSICGMGIVCMNAFHSWEMIFLWVSLIAYAIFLYRRYHQPDNSIPAQWPSRCFAVCFVVLFGGGTLLTFRILSEYLDKSYDSSMGSSLTWAALGLILAYPNSIEKPFGQSERWMWKWLAPVLIVAVLLFHTVQKNVLNAQLDAAEISPGQIAETALKKGYTNTGIEAILRNTSQIYSNQGWIEAVRYHRETWQWIGKERLAQAFLKHPSLGKNLFLFTTCYGSTLELEPGELAIDLVFQSNMKAYRILTSKGRLLRLSEDGFQCIQSNESNPAAVAITQNRNMTAILSASGEIEIIGNGAPLESIALRKDRLWKDIIIHPDGYTLWVLDGNGRIEKMSWNVDRTVRNYPEEIHPAMWGEADIAQAFYPGGRADTFFIVDRANGIHYRGNPPIPDSSPLKMQLLENYNIERPVAINLGYWNPLSSLMMIEKTGRILFVPIPDFSDSSASIAELASATQPIPLPIESPLQYDPDSSTWFRKLETVTAVAIPEVKTIIQLQKNGTLQAIIMPQRFHIYYAHADSNRIHIQSPNVPN